MFINIGINVYSQDYFISKIKFINIKIIEQNLNFAKRNL